MSPFSDNSRDLWIANGLVVSPLPDGTDVTRRSILVRDGIIRDLVTPETKPPVDLEVIDASNQIVIPGLVNAHVHSHGVLAKWTVDTLPLEAWSPYVAASRAALTPDDGRLSALLLAIECLRNGVTAVLDHPVYTEALFEATVDAYLESGIRASMALQCMDRPFHETLPSTPGDEGERPRLWSGSAPSAQSLIELTDYCLKRWRGVADRLTMLVGPATPLRCTEALLSGLARLARDYETGVHTHYLETRTEAMMGPRLYGRPLAAWLEDRDLLGPHVSLAHGVWIERAEVQTLARAGVTVVHNPLSNLALGSGIMPLTKLRDAGVQIGLGTDSPNSGGHHSIFESMRLGASLPRALEPDSSRWPGPDDLFRYATLGGARALGLEDRIGSIQPGKAADLVLLKRTTALTPLNDPVRQIVFCERGDSVDTVIVDGRIVVRGSRLLTLDEDQVLEQAQAAGEALFERSRGNLNEAEQQQSIILAALATSAEAYRFPPLWRHDHRDEIT